MQIRGPAESWTQSLRCQHAEDLRIYQQAHQILSNRILHWIMIPIECGSIFLLLALMIPNLLLWCIGLSLGGLSILIVRKKKFTIGIASCLFHIGTVPICIWIVDHWGPPTCLLGALVAWTMAWFFQVCIGHWILEGNQPNVADMQSVSYLAMCQSVLISWST